METTTTKIDGAQYDVIVIGSGPGGYTAAIYGAKKKLKVALIEKEKLGGTCLNRGCIPTKTLIHSASFYNETKLSANFGINLQDTTIDWDQVQNNKNSVVAKLRSGIQGLLKGNKVTVYKGDATLIDANTVSIHGQNNEILTTKNIIIATGSVPVPPPFPGGTLEGVITSDEALEFTDIPTSMVIVGGGVIGIEMAYIYNTFGTEVTIIEMLPEILPREDKDVVAEIKKVFKNKNIHIITNTKLTVVEKEGNNLIINYEGKDEVRKITAEKVLVSIGRNPVTSVLGSVEVAIDKKGIIVDENLKTNIPGIYAIGDVTGKIMLAHVASHQGIKAVENIMGVHSKMSYSIIPSCIYTNPEIASVGLSEEVAKVKYGSIKVGKFPFSASGKATVSGENIGFVKIIADEKWNEILGVHIIGPHATELIAEATLAIKLQCTVEEFADTIHAHPTLSESLMESSLDVFNEAIHKL